MQHNKLDPQSPRRHEFFHSSGYAGASQARYHVGSTDNVSFNQRITIDTNRQMVDRYRGVRHIDPRRQYTSPFRERNTSDGGQARPPQAPAMPRTFTEPPRRGYNPYS